MKILHLTLKKKWFDMIASGEKTEEYREIKPFWEKRLISNYNELHDEGWGTAWFYDFDAVHFARGGHFRPSLPQVTLMCVRISVGTGKPEWGAEPEKKYFVIKLGKILNH